MIERQRTLFPDQTGSSQPAQPSRQQRQDTHPPPGSSAARQPAPHSPSLARLKQTGLLARRRAPLASQTGAGDIPLAQLNVQEALAFATEAFRSSKAAAAVGEQAATKRDGDLAAEAIHVLRLDLGAEEVEINDAKSSKRLDRLRGVATLTSQSPAPELQQLLRRLRTTAAQLEFHVYNARPREMRVEDALWLPANTGAGSKHRISAAANLRTKQQQAKDSRPSPQASELQTTLLAGLQRRLLLKLAVAALRHAAQARRRISELVDRSETLGRNQMAIQVVKVWRQAAIPDGSNTAVAAALFHARACVGARRCLAEWRARAEQTRRREEALQRGLQARRELLLRAAIAQWRLAAGLKQLSALRAALATGWRDAWPLRSALVVWRRAAARRRSQRHALLAATTGRKSAAICPSPPVRAVNTTAEALETTRAGLEGLRACVVGLAAELAALRQQRRWTAFPEDLSTPVRPPTRTAAYNPAIYSSPAKKRRGGVSASAALAEELFLCREEADRAAAECGELRRKVDMAGNEADAAGGVLEAAEREFLLAKQALAGGLADAESMAAQEGEEAQAAAGVAAEESRRHAARLKSCLQEAEASRGAAAAAATAQQRAEEDFMASAASVAAWRGRVAAAAADLSRSADSSKPAAAVKLREARGRLDAEQVAAQELERELPGLAVTAEAAMQQAKLAETALVAVQQDAIAAAAAEAAVNARATAARAAVAAASGAVQTAREAAASAAAALEMAKTRAGAARSELRVLSQALFTRERELEALQARAADLDGTHARLIALEMEQRQGAMAEVLALPPPPPLLLLAPPSSSDPQPAAAASGNEMLLARSLWGDNAGAEEDETEQYNDLHRSSLSAAAQRYYKACLLRRALRALRDVASWWKYLHVAADMGYQHAHLPSALTAWRAVAADAAAADEEACERLRAVSCFRTWSAYASRSHELRCLQAGFMDTRERDMKATCFAALRAHLALQHRHQTALDAAALRRTAALLAAWRAWSSAKTSRRDTLEVAAERLRLRRLSAAVQQWRSEARSLVLLRRVFTFACDSWAASMGAAGYEAEFNLLQRSFSAWRVAAQAQQEDRRTEVLAIEADALRRRHLLDAALRGLQEAGEWSRQRKDYLPMGRIVLMAWRCAAAGTSVEHDGSAAVARLRLAETKARKALHAWRSAATATACRVSAHWLRWQVDQRAVVALRAWRHAAGGRRRWETRRAEAEALRSKHSSPASVAGLSLELNDNNGGSNRGSPLAPFSVACELASPLMGSPLPPTRSGASDSPLIPAISPLCINRNNGGSFSPAMSVGLVSPTLRLEYALGRPKSAGSGGGSGGEWLAKAKEWRRRQTRYANAIPS